MDAKLRWFGVAVAAYADQRQLAPSLDDYMTSLSDQINGFAEQFVERSAEQLALRSEPIQLPANRVP